MAEASGEDEEKDSCLHRPFLSASPSFESDASNADLVSPLAAFLLDTPAPAATVLKPFQTNDLTYTSNSASLVFNIGASPARAASNGAARMLDIFVSPPASQTARVETHTTSARALFQLTHVASVAALPGALFENECASVHLF